MAQRITDRFDTLLAKSELDTRDREFATSLYDYYKANKRLSTGRRQWLTKLEQKYTPNPSYSEQPRLLPAPLTR